MRRRAFTDRSLFPRRLCSILRAIGTFLIILAAAGESHAANRRWTGGNGTFSDPGEWQGGIVAGVNDVGQFGLSSFPFQLTYTVSFTTFPTNQALHIEDDVVTFDLNGRTYTTLEATGNQIGNQPGGFTGALTITDGTWQPTPSGAFVDIGAVANAPGALTVAAGGRISNSPFIIVGSAGPGTLTIQNGGLIPAASITLGLGASGTATVTGAGSELRTSILNVGGGSSGTLNVTAGGFVQSAGNTTLGSIASGPGTVNVDGADSEWINAQDLVIGDAGSGTLNISDGGRVENRSAYLGDDSGGVGLVNVEGADSQWVLEWDLEIGSVAQGTLNIKDGGRVDSTLINVSRIGRQAGAVGVVTVDGAGSQWNTALSLFVGMAGQGTLHVTGGGQVQNENGSIGSQPGGSGTVNIDGEGSQWINSAHLTVGGSTASAGGNGVLNITGGGRVQNFEGRIGLGTGTMGAVTVAGADSQWINSGQLLVGFLGGTGSLSIEAGGTVTSPQGTIGKGEVTVTGAGSNWTNSGPMLIAVGAPGTLKIEDGASVVTGNVNVGNFVGSPGIITVTGVGSNCTVNGAIDAGGGGGTPTLTISPGAVMSVSLGIDLHDGATLNLEGGTLDAQSVTIPATFGGQFNWPSGTLHVANFNGNLVNQDGTLAPGHSAGSTVVAGNYTQQPPAVLEIEVGGVAQGAQFDFVNVTGTATLDGFLDVRLIHGFQPTASQTFVVLSAASLSGAFDNAANGQRVLAPDGIRSFVVNYGAGSPFNPNQVVLSNFQLAADFDEDGDVDDDDLLNWRAGFGTVGVATHMQGDADGDVDADGRDFLVWQRQLGIDASPTTAVPEPASSALLCLAALTLVRRTTCRSTPSRWQRQLGSPAVAAIREPTSNLLFVWALLILVVRLRVAVP